MRETPARAAQQRAAARRRRGGSIHLHLRSMDLHAETMAGLNSPGRVAPGHRPVAARQPGARQPGARPAARSSRDARPPAARALPCGRRRAAQPEGHRTSLRAAGGAPSPVAAYPGGHQTAEATRRDRLAGAHADRSRAAGRVAQCTVPHRGAAAVALPRTAGRREARTTAARGRPQAAARGRPQAAARGSPQAAARGSPQAAARGSQLAAAWGQHCHAAAGDSRRPGGAAVARQVPRDGILAGGHGPAHPLHHRCKWTSGAGGGDCDVVAELLASVVVAAAGACGERRPRAPDVQKRSGDFHAHDPRPVALVLLCFSEGAHRPYGYCRGRAAVHLGRQARLVGFCRGRGKGGFEKEM